MKKKRRISASPWAQSFKKRVVAATTMETPLPRQKKMKAAAMRTLRFFRLSGAFFAIIINFKIDDEEGKASIDFGADYSASGILLIKYKYMFEKRCSE